MAAGLMPGPPVPQEAIALVKKALSEGKPVAANAYSGIVLAEAGVLRGKKFAFYTDPLNMPELYKIHPGLADGIYSGRGVVQDGKIITYGLSPWHENVMGIGIKGDGTVQLTRSFIAELGSK